MTSYKLYVLVNNMSSTCSLPVRHTCTQIVEYWCVLCFRMEAVLKTVLLVALAAVRVAATSPRPHIVFIVADDLVS